MLNDAIDRIQALIEQKNGNHILHTSEITRTDRELLLHHHWLEEIIRGWYHVVPPDLPPGDSTAWYAIFWDFLNLYLKYHYGNEYCLSAESSIDLHLGNSAIPKQIIVIASRGSGSPLSLPYQTSLLVYADPNHIPEKRVEIRGIQVMPLEYALCKITPVYFQRYPDEAEIALRSIKDSSLFLNTIINHHFKSAASRIIGAYQFLNNTKMATEIKNGLREVGINVKEINPFSVELPILKGRQFISPYVARIHTLWAKFRQTIINHFPKPPGLPKEANVYLDHIAELYIQDAYNSLSIEGYQVTRELIERVKEKKWNPDRDLQDKQRRDALAARGYFEAFEEVRRSVQQIFNGESPGQVVEQRMTLWYQKLFAPSVRAGIIPASDLFGYRRNQVYIRNSRHVPPAKEHLIDLMEAFFDLLKQEEHPGVRSILGHFIFVYIHPYMDGNGRIARFIMNAMLASGGYSWTIIHVTNRQKYFFALESAGVHGDILPFTQFILSELEQHKSYLVR